MENYKTIQNWKRQKHFKLGMMGSMSVELLLHYVTFGYICTPIHTS